MSFRTVLSYHSVPCHVIVCCVVCLLLICFECVCVIAEAVFSIPGIFLHRDPGKRTALNLAVQG